jgi:DNA-binding SARP family transcriptional activator
MGILQVALFGGMRVTHNNWLSEVIMTREIQALLAYLLLQRQRVHSREILAGTFWEDYSQERARGSLTTALWKLKKALEPEGIPAGTYLKSTHLGEVGFNQESQYWLDIEVFEDEVNRILICPFQTVEEIHVVDFVRVLELYKGEVLEGFFDNWALRERERMCTLYLKSMVYLLKYYWIHRGYERAIAYGQQILDLDPMREEIHREMMRLFIENGQGDLALRQYEICHSTLAKEFGISPMQETQALYVQIITGNDWGRLPNRQALKHYPVEFCCLMKKTLTENRSMLKKEFLA